MWEGELDPVMDPKQKCFVKQFLLQNFVSGFVFCFLQQNFETRSKFASSFENSNLEANLLQLLKFLKFKQICFEFRNSKPEANLLQLLIF